MPAGSYPAEAVVTVDGRPRSGAVLGVHGSAAVVRYADAGTVEERTIPAYDVVVVEAAPAPPVGRTLRLTALGCVGAALVLSGGSGRPLASTPAVRVPTPVAPPSPVPAPVAAALAGPAPGPTRAAFFGDSFVVGRGVARGGRTSALVAAAALGWDVQVRGGDGTGFSTAGRRGGSAYRERVPRELASTPLDLVLLQGGTSDTGTPTARLETAVSEVVDEVRRVQPSARVVLMGPVAMQQPVDRDLRRVDAALRRVAQRRKLAYLSPIDERWVGASQALGWTADDGYYPDAVGQSHLGSRLAADLKALTGA